MSSFEHDYLNCCTWRREMREALAAGDFPKARELAKRIITTAIKYKNTYIARQAQNLIEDAQIVLDALPPEEIGFGPHEGA